ncbi:hypothetical protein JCM33374_g1601 [Metschnikowia sp. JCM 33374]|nr:hypothetical protein JCM33374_g1601 [Metschnikowia sp. JCM 33374]
MSKLAKTNLRRSIKDKLGKLSEAKLAEQSKNVYDALVKHQQFRNAKSVALFMSMPKLEVSMDHIIKYCFDHEKTVFLPKCMPPSASGNSMTFLKINSLHEVNSLRPAGRYKLREPSHGEDIMTTGSLDLIIVPGVGFTRSGDRLGHGAGYYDKFLNDFQTKFNRVPFLMGICLADQLVDDLPTEPHDWRMDHVVAADHSS